MTDPTTTFTPEGHVDDVSCWCKPEVHPVDGLMHVLIAADDSQPAQDVAAIATEAVPSGEPT